MSSNVAKAYVQVVPTTKGFASAISSSVGGEATTAGSSIGSKLGSGIMKAVIALGIGKAIKESITAGAELEQAIGGIETVFKKSTEGFQTAMKNADNAWKTVGMSSTKYMENATLFGAAFSKNISDTNEMAKLTQVALSSAGDTANKFGMDMDYVVEAYQSLMRGNYQMLDSIAPGYAGTKTGLQELLKATSSYKQEQKDLGLTVDATSTDFDNIVKALAVYNKHMGVTGTTAKEASETFSGSMNAMKSAWTNFLANLALNRNVGESISALFTSLVWVIKNSIRMLTNILISLPQAIVLSLGKLGDAFLSNFPTIRQNVNKLFQQIANTITKASEFVIKDLPKVFKKITNEFSRIIGNIADGFTDSLPTLTKKFNDMFNFIATNIPKWSKVIYEGIGNIAKEMGTKLGDAFNSIAPILIDSVVVILSNIMEKLPTYFGNLIPTVLKFIADIVQSLANYISTVNWVALFEKIVTALFTLLPRFLMFALNAIGEIVKGIIKGLPSVLSALGSLLRSMLGALASLPIALLSLAVKAVGNIMNSFLSINWGSIGARVVSGIITAFASLPGKMLNLAKSALQGFKNGISGAYDLGVNIVKGIINGVGSMASNLYNSLKNLASNALNSAKKFLGIHSPSRVFRDEIGKFIPEGVAVGIEANTNALDSSLEGMKDYALNVVSEDFNLNRLNTSSRQTTDNSNYFVQILNILMAIYNKDSNTTIQIDRRELGRLMRDMGIQL